MTDIVDPGSNDRAPVEGKVWGGTVGATAGGAVGSLATWVLGVFVWGAPNTAEAATEAIAAVPWPVAGALLVGVAAVGSFVGGFFTKHTPRVLDGKVAVPATVNVPPVTVNAEVEPVVDEPEDDELEDIEPEDESGPGDVDEDESAVLTEEDGEEDASESTDDFEFVENPEDKR